MSSVLWYYDLALGQWVAVNEGTVEPTPAPEPEPEPTPEPEPQPEPEPEPTDPAPAPEPEPTGLTHDALLKQRKGYALNGSIVGAGTTSDTDSSKHYLVTNTADSGAGSLRAGMSVSGRWIRFDPSLDGQTIGITSAISPASNITVDGRGRDITIRGTGSYAGSSFNISNTNIILCNLKILGSSAQVGNGKADGININGSGPQPHVWMHHLSVTGHGDKCIGLPRIGKCEISWCSLFKSGSVSHGVLLGTLSTSSSQGNAFLTMHHNRLYGYTDRYPRVGDGAYAHVFNNYMDAWGTYAAKAIRGGRMLAQNNFFGNVNTNGRCIEHTEGAEAIGYVRSSGNVLNGGSASNNGNLTNTPEPPYTYTLDIAGTTLKDTINANAGWKAATFWS